MKYKTLILYLLTFTGLESLAQEAEDCQKHEMGINLTPLIGASVGGGSAYDLNLLYSYSTGERSVLNFRPGVQGRFGTPKAITNYATREFEYNDTLTYYDHRGSFSDFNRLYLAVGQTITLERNSRIYMGYNGVVGFATRSDTWQGARYRQSGSGNAEPIPLASGGQRPPHDFVVENTRSYLDFGAELVLGYRLPIMKTWGLKTQIIGFARHVSLQNQEIVITDLATPSQNQYDENLSYLLPDYSKSSLAMNVQLHVLLCKAF